MVGMAETGKNPPEETYLAVIQALAGRLSKLSDDIVENIEDRVRIYSLTPPRLSNIFTMKHEPKMKQQ